MIPVSVLSYKLASGLLRLPLLMCCVLITLNGCGGRYVATDRGVQAYYQTGYPVHDTSRELEQIFKSVKRLQVTGYYTTYIFPRAEGITEGDIHRSETYAKAIEQITFDHSKAGTATVLAYYGPRVTLITNEHVVTLPDTIVFFYEDAGISEVAPRIVESISVLQMRTNLVFDIPEVGFFTVLAMDREADLAVIGVNLQDRTQHQRTPDMLDLSKPYTIDPLQAMIPHGVYPLSVRLGDPSRLSWGSFLYVAGYPRGFKMVTRGIVSDPNRGRDNSFLLDALFNRGVSGGLILAVRGDTGTLEWVGMARSGSAQTEYILLPEEKLIEEAGIIRPYDGNLYLQRVPRIDYGITHAISTTTIRRFLQRNNKQIRDQGYRIEMPGAVKYE